MASRKISPDRCGVLPAPGAAKLYLPGLALMTSISSFIDLGRHRGMHGHDVGRHRDDGDRRKILHRIVGHLGEQARVDHEPGADDQQRVAVGGRGCHHSGRRVAAGARLVDDVELLAEAGRELVGHDAGDDIGRAAGRKSARSRVRACRGRLARQSALANTKGAHATAMSRTIAFKASSTAFMFSAILAITCDVANSRRRPTRATKGRTLQ